jgi:hypothetical protein
MNTKKILLGGLVAGVVMNIIDVIVNVVIFGEQWKIQTQALHVDMSKAQCAGICWMLVDFALAFILVWLYAAIRPRFGAGMKTATFAGLVVWAVGHLMLASYTFMGLYSCSLITGSAIGALVATLAAAYAGCALYKEK